MRDADSEFVGAPRAPELHIPFAVYGLLLFLAAMFLVEGGACWGSGDFNIDRGTILSLGGLALPLVEQGQWFRMETAALLHWSFSHLAFNGLALFFAAPLERVVGPAWFLAIFLVSALGGSALSLAVNDPAVVSAGASGAILGVFGAQIVAAYVRLEHKGKFAKSLGDTAWRILIPTLAALTGGVGERLDFGAHLGGALTGAAACALLVKLWSRRDKHPPHASVAWTIVAAGAVLLLYAAFGPLQMTHCRAP